MLRKLVYGWVILLGVFCYALLLAGSAVAERIRTRLGLLTSPEVNADE
jgi:hypothetical protein